MRRSILIIKCGSADRAVSGKMGDYESWFIRALGGDPSRKLRSTGFFRTDKVDGRWALIDPHGHPFYSAGIDIVAKELAMSSRSLSRALAKLGTSFHAVVETLRKDLAHEYLKQSDLTLKEITFLLGYADISSFNHAFKRWTGKTPSDVRFRG